MTEDLIEQADMLLKDFNSSGYISKYVMVVLPQLVAEIKRLRTDNEFLHKFVDAPGSTPEAAIAECKRLQEQLVAWQKIAIEEYAKFLFYLQYDDDPDPRISWHKEKAERPEFVSKYYDQAAKELGLQVTQEAGYVERLEKEYLATWKWINPEDGEQAAQAALEKIRKG